MYGATIGKVGMVGITSVTNQAVCACTPNDLIDRNFLLLLLKSLKFYFISLGAGGAQPNISREKIVGTVFGLPPFSEQSRIVAKVKQLMALIDRLESAQTRAASTREQLTAERLAKLAASENADDFATNWQALQAQFELLLDSPESIDQLQQTLLQLAVRGKLTRQDTADEPAAVLLERIRAEKATKVAAGKGKKEKPLPQIDDEELPYELPVGWEWVRLGDVIQIASNLVSPSQYQNMLQVAPDLIEKGSGCLIGKRTVLESGIISPNHYFKDGQILYSKIRPSLSKVVIAPYEGLCSADMYPIDSLINTAYLHRLMLSGLFLAQVVAAENRVKMPKLNQEALVNFVIPLPPAAEQSRIVEKIEQLTALCSVLKVNLATRRINAQQLGEATLQNLSN